MSQDFKAGDFLVFQIESGYAMLRILGVESMPSDPVWHIAVYRDLYLDVNSAEEAAFAHQALKIEIPHVALTNRAFESTQVAHIKNVLLTPTETEPYEKWKSDPNREISDRSVRLLLGLR